MGVKAALASFGGDLWRSWSAVAFWPYPAVVYRGHHPKFSWSDYRCLTKYIRPGDFILATAEPYFLSNMAISGTALKHGAVYTGAVQAVRGEDGFLTAASSLGVSYEHTGAPSAKIFERTVCHAISEGIVVQDLGELLFHSDYVMAVRPWTDEAEQEHIVKAALGFAGRAYDFDFNTKNQALYCTEVLGVCAMNTGIIPPDQVKINTSILGLLLPLARFKEDAYIADSFLIYPPVVCSDSCREMGFQRQSRFAELVRVAVNKAPSAGAEG